MKKILLVFVAILFCFLTVHAKDVQVKGYYRKDGTYVRPHHRSSPDGIMSNNYGRASYKQRQQYENYSVIPSYNNDYDDDGIANHYDYDDDNDNIMDEYDSNQYGRNKSKSYTETYSTDSNKYNHYENTYNSDLEDYSKESYSW